jgi:hypothetical protein
MGVGVERRNGSSFESPPALVDGADKDGGVSWSHVVSQGNGERIRNK